MKCKDDDVECDMRMCLKWWSWECKGVIDDERD